MTDERNCDDHLGLVDAWLRDYVSVRDPRVGRSGPVCPFIPRALNQHAVETRIRSDIDGSSESELIDELGAEIVDFCSSGRPPSKSGAPLESRIIVMPQMDSDGWGRLDAVYEPLKELAVESGTMIGKFHPGCDDRAIRNSEFKVSISPVAMLAIRHMAPHDILFLNDSERWFREYDSRFSAHFEHNKVRDPFLLSLYSKARVSYGSSA